MHPQSTDLVAIVYLDPNETSRWFLDGTGHAGLNSILAGFDDKTAYAQCVFAFCAGPGKEVKVRMDTCMPSAHCVALAPWI